MNEAEQIKKLFDKLIGCLLCPVHFGTGYRTAK